MDTIEGLGNRLKELRTERDMSLDMVVYDINQRYWSLTKNGEYMMTGMDMTPIADGEHYEITYAK